jgi:hypothetical protein
LAAALAASACTLFVPKHLDVLALAAVVTICAAIMFTAALMSAGQLRGLAFDQLMSVVRRQGSKTLAPSATMR